MPAKLRRRYAIAPRAFKMRPPSTGRWAAMRSEALQNSRAAPNQIELCDRLQRNLANTFPLDSEVTICSSVPLSRVTKFLMR